MTTFWGLILESGKRYKQSVESQFHLTMAALDTSSVDKNTKNVALMVENEGNEYLVCNLQPEKSVQERLDLMFAEGEEVTFFLKGKATVHLTGYTMPEDDFGAADDDDDISLDDEEKELLVQNTSLNGKRKGVELSLPGKKIKSEEAKKPNIVDLDPTKDLKNANKKDNKQQPQQQKKQPVKPSIANDDEDDSDDNLDIDSDMDSEDLNKMLAEADDDDIDEEDDFEDDDEDDDDLDDADSEDEKLKNIQQKVKSKLNAQPAKPASQTPNKPQHQNQKQQQNGQTPKNKPQNQQQQKGNNKDQNRQQTPFVKGKPQNQQQNSNKKGTPFQKNKNQTPGSQNKNFVEDTSIQPLQNTQNKSSTDSLKSKSATKKLSNGLIIQDLVEGTGPEAKKGKFLHMNYVGRLSDNKVFDQTSNRPFSFRLGMGSVIRGWDLGLIGMKVNGKRRLIIPANLAYGKSRVGKIPGNSTLIFDCELKGISQ